VQELDRLAARQGYPVRWELGARERAAIGKVPEAAWEIAVDGKGQVRERRSDDAALWATNLPAMPPPASSAAAAAEP